MMMKFVTVSMALVLSLSGTAFAQGADTANPYGTSKVDPAGPNEIIFSVSKGSRTSGFTVARLQKMKSSTISIYEPFLKKRQTFTVIPVKNFFSLVGISGNDKVQTIALNDYIYSNTAAQFIAAKAYIAIERNGREIPYDQGGPIRLIFADNSKWAKNLDAWNWSLASIRVR